MHVLKVLALRSRELGHGEQPFSDHTLGKGIDMGLFDLFKKKDANAEKPERDVAATAAAAGAVALVAPVSGETLQLKETTEPLFSAEMLGKGIAIKPSGDTACAPVSGTVTMLMPHAVGVTTAGGVEVLIHVGVETVNMKGEGFESLVAQGDAVEAGQPTLRFDAKKIAAAGCEDTVFVVVTNTAECADVSPVPDGHVEVGDPVVHVTK